MYDYFQIEMATVNAYFSSEIRKYKFIKPRWQRKYTLSKSEIIYNIQLE